MFKKFFIYTLFLFFSLNCFAKNQTIQDIEDYLNNIKYLKANFLQDDKANSELVEGVFLCISTGTFLYVACSEVIVEEFSTPKKRYLKFSLYLLGVILAAGLTLFEHFLE